MATFRKKRWRLAAPRLRMNAATYSFPDRPERSRSIHSLLRLDVLDIVGERVFVHRAVIDPHLAALAAPAVEPACGVLHPVGVVALREVLVGMGAARFLAVVGRMERHRCLAD